MGRERRFTIAPGDTVVIHTVAGSPRQDSPSSPADEALIHLRSLTREVANVIPLLQSGVFDDDATLTVGLGPQWTGLIGQLRHAHIAPAQIRGEIARTLQEDPANGLEPQVAQDQARTLFNFMKGIAKGVR